MTLSRAARVERRASLRPALPACAAAEVASPAAECAFAAALSTFRAGEHGAAVLELTELARGRAPLERGVRDDPTSAAAARARTPLASRGPTSHAR